MEISLLIAVGAAAALMQLLIDRMAARRPAVGEWWYGGWMVICVMLSALEFAQGHASLGLLMAACAVIDGVKWWHYRKRRKRKRAAALLGEKSRALVTKLVRRQREATQGAS